MTTILRSRWTKVLLFLVCLIPAAKLGWRMYSSLIPLPIEFSARTLPIDAAVALRCARLHVPDPRPERDAYIAATALVHGMTVVTRNLADFVPTGVWLLNPWEAAE